MLVIRPMRPEDSAAKAYVHWKSWQETYPGLVDADYLANLSLEDQRRRARSQTDNTIVAELDGTIVGFSCSGPCRDSTHPNWGEVYSIYLLKEAQGLGIGRQLMDAAMERLSGFDTVVLWVLKGNTHASGFYAHYGFQFDGTCKEISEGTEYRMIHKH